MYLFQGVEDWLNYALLLVMMALRIWAVVDCITRKSPAFPAVNKLTKPVWLAITVGSAVLAGVPILYGSISPLNLISLITLVASLVYLADVRPAVREVSGGSGQRW